MKASINRLLSKIIISKTNYFGDSPCWEWEGSKSAKGYGNLNINNHLVRTHRFIFEYYYGMICPDLQINHKCRNKCCCNPLHLEQVNAQQNCDYSRREYLLGLKKRIHHNSKKTHCIHGHEFTPENTHIRTDSTRRCKICHRQRNIKSYQKIKVNQ